MLHMDNLPERLKYHFEPRKGWMNDPNGLIYFRGKYHAFFQHYPHAPRWGQMHWGHAVSEDLISWQELDIALYPDMPYENSGGCYSGSAIEKDGKMYLFYTSVSRKLGQTQSLAISEDGIHFHKHEQNPIISHFPKDGSKEFRDPKVIKIGDTYYMVCGSGKKKVGKVLLYASADLLRWKYQGVLFESKDYSPVLECPDFFPLDGRYVLMFSKMGLKTHSTQFIAGDFSDNKFYPEAYSAPEAGPHFYAPQTFADPQGRRIMIGWLYSWGKKLDKGADYAGALTIPRELRLKDGRIINYPVSEAHSLLAREDELVRVSENSVTVSHPKLILKYDAEIRSVAVLRDSKTIEAFVNGGEASFTYWFGK